MGGGDTAAGCGSAPRSTPDRSPAHADRETHGAELHPETVAAYIAKYATKAAADLPTDQNGGNGHLRRLQTTLRQLAGRAVVRRPDRR